MLELLYSSGLKVHELLKLDTLDLFLDLGFLKVRRRRERMVPVTTMAIEALQKYLKEGRQDRLRYAEDLCLFPTGVLRSWVCITLRPKICACSQLVCLVPGCA